MDSKVFSILKGDDWEEYSIWKNEPFSSESIRESKDKHPKIDHPLGYRATGALICNSCSKKARQHRNKIITPIIRKIGSIIKKLVNESNGAISVDYSKKSYKDTALLLKVLTPCLRRQFIYSW